MRTVLSLYLPWWSVDRVKRRWRKNDEGATRDDHGPPIILVQTVSQRQVVARCCELCLHAGVRVGMTLAHARALVRMGGVHVEDFAAQRDNDALLALACWATRFTPLVAPDPPDGLILDVTGCSRLFRGIRRLVDRLVESVSALGFRARVGAAPTIGCAWAVARFGARAITFVDPAGVRGALAGLPTAALRLDEDTQAGLCEVGIETIGHLFDLPRSALPPRFGEDLLLRLDQAFGQAIEVIVPVRPVEPSRVEVAFDGPTTRLEAIEHASWRLLERLTGVLARQGSGVRRLDVHLVRSDAPPVSFVVSLSRPSRSTSHLWSLLRPRLEKTNLGFGIEHIVFEAARTGRVRHEQYETVSAGAALSRRDTEKSIGEMIDTLVNRLGGSRVTRIEVRESHVPERVFTHRAVMGESTERAVLPTLVDADRPSLLLGVPEPATAIALVLDGPPSRLRWRGNEHAIVRAIGPERVAGEWWRLDRARDYFKVQDDSGRWLWVFRLTGTAQWFVHGLWG